MSGKEYRELLEEKKVFLEKFDEGQVVDLILEGGDFFNSGVFPAFDIAYKAKTYGWTLTEKQINALKNTIARFLAINDRVQLLIEELIN